MYNQSSATADMAVQCCTRVKGTTITHQCQHIFIAMVLWSITTYYSYYCISISVM